MSIQDANGDLRGPQKGGGSGQGNMYDHAIGAFALGDAALMTGDPRYTEAATRACDFIIKAQHPESGGWRYAPGEFGDTSVFGWQIMALNRAEKVGFKIPDEARQRCLKYIDIASTGQHKMLAGYQPGAGATPPMSAELLLTRILLGQEFTPEGQKEVCDYLLQNLPNEGAPDVYYWYYGSLSLNQFQNDAWRTWNQRTRDTLIKLQRKEGPLDGSWDTNMRWGDHAGRVYTTALSTLTLEVYYRYLDL